MCPGRRHGRRVADDRDENGFRHGLFDRGGLRLLRFGGSEDGIALTLAARTARRVVIDRKAEQALEEAAPLRPRGALLRYILAARIDIFAVVGAGQAARLRPVARRRVARLEKLGMRRRRDGQIGAREHEHSQDEPDKLHGHRTFKP